MNLDDITTINAEIRETRRQINAIERSLIGAIGLDDMGEMAAQEELADLDARLISLQHALKVATGELPEDDIPF